MYTEFHNMGWQYEPPEKHHSQDQAFLGAWGGESEFTANGSAKPKSNVLHLKMGAWKRSFLLESIIFSVHGSFAGGGGCWLLKHFQRIWGSHFGSIFAWHETRGMAWCYYYMVTGSVFLCRFDSGIFSKKLLSMTYCSTVSTSNSYGIFSKSIFLKQQKPFFFQSFFCFFQKIPQKSLESIEVFIAGCCPWSWYRSSRGEQWLLNGNLWEANEANVSKQKRVTGLGVVLLVLHVWGAGTTVGYERNLPCNTFLSDFYFVFEYFFWYFFDF